MVAQTMAASDHRSWRGRGDHTRNYPSSAKKPHSACKFRVSDASGWQNMESCSIQMIDVSVLE